MERDRRSQLLEEGMLAFCRYELRRRRIRENMEKERTGKTKTMLEEALEEAVTRGNVWVIMHTQRMVDYAMSFMAFLCTNREVAFNMDRKRRSFYIGGNWVRFMSVDNERLKDTGTHWRIEGVSVDTPILIDHAVYDMIFTKR